jgi:hypothetical protein
MKIRFGTYTLMDGIEMKIFGNRYEVPVPENEKTYGVSYPAELGRKDGFKLNELLYPYSDEYIREINIQEITNAFLVITKAKYKGEVFEVEPYFGDDIHLHLATKDLELGKKLGFYELHDSYGKPYYLGEVAILEVEEIWEERSPSSFNLPLPVGLELIKIIKSPHSLKSTNFGELS